MELAYIVVMMNTAHNIQRHLGGSICEPGGRVLGDKDTKRCKGETTMAQPIRCIDRRAYYRNSLHTPAIAVVRAKPTIILGQIEDISPAGLSFTYMTNSLQFDEMSELEILLPGEKYYLNGLSFTTVSDAVVPKGNPFSMVTMSRRRVKFSDLTPLQKSKLSELIKKIARAHADIKPSMIDNGAVAAQAAIQPGI